MSANIGYKVVLRLKNGDRVSCLVSKESGLRETYISHGEAKTVDNGFIFINESTAQTWIRDFISFELCTKYHISNYEVWECEYDEAFFPARILAYRQLITKKSIVKGLKNWRDILNVNLFNRGYIPNELMGASSVYPISGSRIAKKVKLTKKLGHWENRSDWIAA